jgi:hypothetical protein
MKKLMFLAICLMAMMMGCKQKGQKSLENSKDSVTAVIDSIIEENDTTPLPMFLVGNDGKYMQMLYWTNFEEPKKSGDDDEFFETYHKRWELQEMFRRNAAQYTNLLCGDKIIKVKFVDEVQKDPDGNTPSVGEIHSREGIPSLCARYDYANPKEKPHKQSLIDSWGLVVCTDSYLASRKRLDIQHLQADDYSYPTKLPADIVQKLEKQYGMKAESAVKTCVIDGRYTMGAVQFKGEYKNAPKDKYDPDRKFALALEVLIDSGKVYILEQLGYFDPQYGSSWNVDADGYFPNDITAAFEGPKGLELCYTHSAPESFCIGMLFPREGKLVEMEYECYHSLVDEEIPVWKKDLAEMDKIYHADEMGDRNVALVKWAHCYIDNDNEWIWMRDMENKNGAFFIRKDGKFQLMAVENPRFRPLKCYKDGISYLKLAGPAGGPSWQREIHAFKNGKRIWKLNVLEVEGKIDECSLNDKDISNEEGKAYLDMVPEGEEITAFFKEINPKE